MFEFGGNAGCRQRKLYALANQIAVESVHEVYSIAEGRDEVISLFRLSKPLPRVKHASALPAAIAPAVAGFLSLMPGNPA